MNKITRCLGGMLVLLSTLTGCIAEAPEDTEEDLLVEEGEEEEVGEAADALVACGTGSTPDVTTSVDLYNVQVNPSYGQAPLCPSHFVIERFASTAGTYRVSASLPGNYLSAATCSVGKVQVYVWTSNGTALSDQAMGTWNGTSCVATAEVTFSEAAQGTFRAAVGAERGYIDGRQAVQVPLKFSEYKL